MEQIIFGVFANCEYQLLALSCPSSPLSTRNNSVPNERSAGFSRICRENPRFTRTRQGYL